MTTQVLIGLCLAALIGGLGYWRGSLSASGFLGALLIGTAVFGLGGWAWGVLLVAFFVSSSALSHFKEARKDDLAEKFSKGQRRDLAQTLANGGLGALLALASLAWPHSLAWAAFAGAMAAVNADTWATELGVLSRSQPRMITTWRPAETGASGAVSLAGTLAALAGAGLIGGLAALFELAAGRAPGRAAGLLLAATAGGLGGSLVDSFLGATLQAIYYCDTCGKETERHPRHRCGQATRLVRGWRWLGNDGVNFVCSLAGSLIAAGLWRWLAPAG